MHLKPQKDDFLGIKHQSTESYIVFNWNNEYDIFKRTFHRMTILLIWKYLFTVSDSSAEADESAFPFLNLTSITMLDEKNHPVKGFFTHTSSGRSAAEIEEEMSDIEYIVYTR